MMFEFLPDFSATGKDAAMARDRNLRCCGKDSPNDRADELRQFDSGMIQDAGSDRVSCFRCFLYQGEQRGKIRRGICVHPRSEITHRLYLQARRQLLQKVVILPAIVCLKSLADGLDANPVPGAFVRHHAAPAARSYSIAVALATVGDGACSCD